MSNTKENKDIKFAERTKPSRGDEVKPATQQGQPGQPEQAQPQTVQQQPQLQLRPFQDGVVLRHSINPRNPKTRVLHDATGVPLAVCLHDEVADLICNAVTFLFVKKEQLRREAEKNLETMSDAAVVAEADGATAAGEEKAPPPFVPVANPEITVLPPEPANNGTATDTP